MNFETLDFELEIDRVYKEIRNNEARIAARQLKWDKFFLGLAQYMSTASKDQSTKVGAVICDRDNRVVSTGYNGFPKGIADNKEDYENREIKLQKVVHAEINAILFAQRSLKEHILYIWPFTCCSRCSVQVIQVGIKRVVSPVMSEAIKERWGKDVELSKSMFKEAGVEVVELEI